MALHLDQNKGPETYQKKFIRVAPNSIFGASWILVTPNIIFQGIVFDGKKWSREKFWREEICLIVFKVAQIEETFKEPWR